MLEAHRTPTNRHGTSYERPIHTQPPPFVHGAAKRHTNTYIHIKRV